MKPANCQRTGVLIAVEGIDGAGKTTQVRLLAEALQSAGEPLIVSKEPTDGRWGRKIRESAVSGRMPLQEELEAFIADRKEHIAHTIEPGLNAGQIVILDRYFYSTIAYQGARGADPQRLEEQMKFAPVPDLVILLDVDPAISISRIANERNETPNEFERHDSLSRVRAIFNSLCDYRPEIHKFDSSQDVAALHREIVAHLIDSGILKRRAGVQAALLKPQV